MSRLVVWVAMSADPQGFSNGLLQCSLADKRRWCRAGDIWVVFSDYLGRRIAGVSDSLRRVVSTGLGR